VSEKILQKIMSGQCSRSDFLVIRNNALRLMKVAQDPERQSQAEKILAACDAFAPAPLSRYYNFMGFCPGADFSRREDERWKAEGVCDFLFYESQRQMEAFGEMLPGDWIILKKREKFGETMKLFGFGKIKVRIPSQDGIISYKVIWNTQKEIIEVPLMGCNATVNIRSLEAVERDMPLEFWDWLSISFSE
jgi:hypothetical protein